MTNEVEIPDEILEEHRMDAMLNEEFTLGERDGAAVDIGVQITNWRDLADKDAPAEWKKLGEFVNWFVKRYSIPQQKIPSCWFQHGVLVEELSALRACWEVSFDLEDGGIGPIGFHERKALAMMRIGEAYHGQCVKGHQPRNIDRPVHGDVWQAWITKAHGEEGT